MISFRLSDAEYRAAEDSAVDNGVRSVSALAKFALINVMAKSGKDKRPSEMKLAWMEQEIRQIKRTLAELLAKRRRP